MPTAPTPTAPAATDVAPPDAIGRLAASFTGAAARRASRRRSRARAAGVPRPGRSGGLHPAAVRRRRVLQPVQGGQRDQDRPDEFLATCVGGENELALRRSTCSTSSTATRPVRRQFRDSCPAPDDASAKRLEAMLALGDRVGDRPERAAACYHRELNRSRSAIVEREHRRQQQPVARLPPAPARPRRRPRGRPRRVASGSSGDDPRRGARRTRRRARRAPRRRPAPAPAPPPARGARRRRGRRPAARRAPASPARAPAGRRRTPPWPASPPCQSSTTRMPGGPASSQKRCGSTGSGMATSPIPSS